ncbi:MAG: DsrE family protein, partial [Gammaproteobacteria bacterium]|nr:DsrE family protein [Gammaproteobacteria bacterium]
GDFMRFHSYLIVAFLISAWSVSFVAMAEKGTYLTKIDMLLQTDDAPEGVVFEVINRDVLFLNWALPEIEKQSQRLRKKFPDLDIVVVSHGREMFALTSKNQSENPELKTQLDSLVSQQVPVYVCGTYAERRGIENSEFPENVKVAAEGPAQINDYIKLGYMHILMKLK